MQTEQLIALDKGPDLVGEAFRRRRKVLADPGEHRLPTVVGRQQALDVLHDEYRRRVRPDDPQILAVEKMLLVRLERRIVGAPGTPRERIRLAWRPSDQDPVRCARKRIPDSCVDQRRGALAQLRVHDLQIGLRRSIPDNRHRIEGSAVDLSPKKVEVRVELACVAQVPPDGAQSQGPTCDLLLLDRQRNAKGRVTPRITQRRKALSQPTRPGEQIDDRYCACSSHSLDPCCCSSILPDGKSNSGQPSSKAVPRPQAPCANVDRTTSPEPP